MSPTFHCLQIVSLATWLSVLGFGVTGLLLHSGEVQVVVREGVDQGSGAVDAQLIGDFSSPPPKAAESFANSPVVATAIPSSLPQVPDLGPLPDLPSPVASSQAATATGATANADALRQKPDGSRNDERPAPTHRSTAPLGGNGGRSKAENDRLAKGSMPKPSYPFEAQRRGQQGTVVVEFTIDASGRVIAAEAVTPSRWPLLNREALRAVRRWKFPAGDVMKLRRPIIFQIP